MVELAWSLRQRSETFDEPCHIYAGYRYVTASDFGVNPEHPPLAKMVAALALLPLGLRQQDAKTEYYKACHAEGKEFLALNDTRTVLFRARSSIAIFTVVLAVLLFLAVRRMFGPWPALATLTLAVFEPNLLANGALVTTDMAAACLMLASVYAFWCYTERPAWWRLALCGVTVGLAFGGKHSGLVMAPILVVLAVVDCGLPSRAGTRWWRRASRLALALGAVGAIAILTLWAQYGFHRAARPKPLQLEPSVQEHSADLPRMEARAIQAANRFGLLPEAYLFGLADVLEDTENGRPTYLAGVWHANGVWYYFPATFLIKSTVGFLVLVVCAVPWLLWRGTARRAALFLLTPAVVYGLFAVTSKLNIGHRHLLPVYPFLLALAGVAAWEVGRRSRGWAVAMGVLIALHAASSARAFPDYLPYANELAGGPECSYRLVTDSSVDWGSGLLQTARYIRERHIGDCWIAYSGTGSLGYWGIPCRQLPGAYTSIPMVATECDTRDPRVRGPIFVSPTSTNGPFFPPGEMNPYAEFLRRRPSANLGGAMLVFEGEYRLDKMAAVCRERKTEEAAQAGDWRATEEGARSALALDPDNGPARVLLLIGLYSTGRRAEALAGVESARQSVAKLPPRFGQTWSDVLDQLK
jgi:4-amino-4-deoxy-L-arabinose transferase-like glycosyltransferase